MLGRVMTLGKAVLLAMAIAAAVGVVGTAFGFQVTGPAQVTRRLDAMDGRLQVFELYVEFLVVKECLDMTDQKKRDMALKGISCDDVLPGGGAR